MTHEKKKLSKITEELTMFFFSIGGNDITFNIKYSKTEAVLTFESNYDPKFSHKLESMNRLLNSEHDDGVEDVYWELVGSGEPGESSQLLLVGMMVDKAEVLIDESRVKITMYKKLST